MQRSTHSMTELLELLRSHSISFGEDRNHRNHAIELFDETKVGAVEAVRRDKIQADIYSAIRSLLQMAEIHRRN